MTAEPLFDPSTRELPDGEGPELLTRREASAWLGRFGIRMKPETLARAYSTGSGGPPCRHVRNKPLYPRDLLSAWAEAQISSPAASSAERKAREAREALRGR